MGTNVIAQKLSYSLKKAAKAPFKDRPTSFGPLDLPLHKLVASKYVHYKHSLHTKKVILESGYE